MTSDDSGLWSLILGHWDMLLGRRDGPLSFRILIQPLVAAMFGIREGVKDARAGHWPYGWLILTRARRRGALVREGWLHVRTVFLAALAIDLIYGYIVFRHVYPGQLLVVVTTLAVLPYVLCRGLSNRLLGSWVRRRQQRLREATTDQP